VGPLIVSILLLQLLLVTATVAAQAQPQSLLQSLEQSWRWRELRRTDTEPTFSIVAAAGDNQLLVADDSGLWRHDGLLWDRIGPWPSGSPAVTDLLHPTEGGHLAVRDRKLLALRDDDPDAPILLRPATVAGPTCRPIELPDGRLLTADRSHLIIVDNQSVTPYLPLPTDAEYASALAFDTQGQLWCATTRGIFRLEGERWEPVVVTSSSPDSAADNAKDIALIVNVGERLVFLPRVFASRQSGLQWDGLQLTPLPSALAQGQLSDALATPEGDLVVAIQYSGLRSLCWSDVRTCTWQPVNVPAPFGASIKSMTLLADGRMAVVTHVGKLLLNDSLSDRWATYDPTAVGVSSVVNSLAHSRRGGLWLGTHDGVARFDGERFVDVFLEAGSLGIRLAEITAVHEDAEGQLWVGSGSAFQGLLRYDGERWHREELPEVTGYGVHSLHADAEGDLWLTMIALSSGDANFYSGAILHRSDDRWIVHDRVGDKPMPRVYSLTWLSDGTLLAGGLGHMVTYDGSEWREFTPTALAPGRSAFALIARSNGDLWMGHGRNDPGLTWLPANAPDWSLPGGTEGGPVTASQRLLQSAAAASFAETENGSLWFAGETGLYHVVRGQCHRVTTQGAGRDHSFWPLLASADGDSLWLGSLGGGLLRLRADDVAPPTTNTPSQFVPDLDHTRNVVLSWSGNDTWSVTPPERLLFSHSLDGAPFSAWSNEANLHFFDARPGPHELAVKAMDSASNAQSAPTILNFEVAAGPPSLWARPEMHAAYAVAFLALCGLGLVTVRRQRERRRDAAARTMLNERLRELTRRLMTTQEDERRSLARDLHDDLGQLLTVTTMQIDLAAGLDDPERRSSALTLASQSTQRAISSVRNLASQIRPTLLDDLGLETAVNATLDDFAGATGMILERDVLFEHDQLPDDVASHVFRIIKESLTNIVRHAHADTISLCLEVTAHAIDILVQDDGDGFDPERSTSDHGIGLLGMRERAEALGGTFTIDSQPGRGTSLHVTIPLLEPQKDGNLPPW